MISVPSGPISRSSLADGNYAGDHVQPFPPVARASFTSTHRSGPLSTAAVIAPAGSTVTVQA